MLVEMFATREKHNPKAFLLRSVANAHARLRESCLRGSATSARPNHRGNKETEPSTAHSKQTKH